MNGIFGVLAPPDFEGCESEATFTNPDVKYYLHLVYKVLHSFLVGFKPFAIQNTCSAAVIQW